MKEQKQRYVGDLDPITKLRHGKGTYQYKNKFFQYDGEWRDGVKHGKGTLFLGDGTKYEGEFQEGEITGFGVKTWPDGKHYEGYFKFGEQEGSGRMEYPDKESYEGTWHLNLREGEGVWTRANGDVIKGEFKGHYPIGNTVINYSNGDLYEGTMDKNGLNGQGKYINSKEQLEYEGAFVNGVYCGQGKLLSLRDGYIYEGEFKENAPAQLPNKLLFVRSVPEDQKKIEDGRAAEYSKKKKTKRDPKKKGNEKPILYPDEEQYPYKIYWGFGTPAINFELQTVFQGEPYIDPVKQAQKEEEQKEAKGKAKKKDAKEEPEFTIPDPVIITAESNRKLQIRMTKTELIKDEETGEEKETDIEYPFIDKSEEMPIQLLTKAGLLEIKDLSYEKTENFDEGLYVVVITDLTESQSPLPEIKIALIIQ